MSISGSSETTRTLNWQHTNRIDKLDSLPAASGARLIGRVARTYRVRGVARFRRARVLARAERSCAWQPSRAPEVGPIRTSAPLPAALGRDPRLGVGRRAGELAPKHAQAKRASNERATVCSERFVCRTLCVVGCVLCVVGSAVMSSDVQ